MAGSLDSHSQPLLEVQNLSKRFGDSAALTNISFSVLEKEIVGVIGPNGAGKTTLLECVAGLLQGRHDNSGWGARADAGRILLGNDIAFSVCRDSGFRS
jgi:ABC-type multidrug transport system ATPase subunit